MRESVRIVVRILLLSVGALGLAAGLLGPMVDDDVEVSVVAMVTVAGANGLYRSWRGISLKVELETTVATWFLAMPVLLFAAFLTKTSDEFSRVNTVLWFVTTPVVLALFRAGARMVLSELRRHGHNTRNVAVAGSTESANALVEYMHADPTAGMVLCGIYDDRTAALLNRPAVAAGSAAESHP